MSASVSAAICFIASHGGPADHFATFAEDLTQRGYKVEIYASGPALQKFEQRGAKNLHPFSLDNTSEKERAVEVAKACSKAAVVITDVGHPFNISLQQALSEEAPKTLRCAYYDNPEPFVPGGYSTVAAKVMIAAERVLFANGKLASGKISEEDSKEIPLPNEKRVGIGYYPLAQAEKIGARRHSDREVVRKNLFEQLRLEDRGQKVVVYTGGNNREYFQNAFPALLRFLKGLDLSKFVFLLQQHPGAKGQNIDGELLQKWKSEEKGVVPFFVSGMSSEDSQVIADGILYYQTSMGPQFILAGIPTIQVGPEPYEDILVRNGLCAVATSSDGLQNALASLGERKGAELGAVERELGIHADWSDKLKSVVDSAISL